MDYSIISTVVITVFLLALLLGFVFGWFRGFSKSLTRFIMVICVAVISFFTVPAISKTLLTMDISKLNITIGDYTAVTVQDLVSNLLREIPIIEELFEASPTLEAFIELLPQLLINIVLFVLVFFIIKYLSMIIYWIISAIFFSKKKTQGKDKHNFIGAVIGALQGVVVAILLFVPFFGLVETVKPVVSAVSTQTVQTQTALNNATAEEESSIDVVVNEAEQVIEKFEDNWVIKVFSSLGVKKLSVGMYDKLTTVKNNKVEIVLREEVNAIANAYPEIKLMMDNNFDVENKDVVDALEGAINKLYKSELLSNIVNEAVPTVCSRWQQGQDFCGVKKPKFDSSSVNGLFDSLLVQLSTADQAEAIKQDLLSSVQIVRLCNNEGVLTAILHGGDVLEVLKGNTDFVETLFDIALRSQTLKAILPDLINVANDFIYEALDVDGNSIDEIEIDSSDITWETSGEVLGEKDRLVNIFAGLFEIYDDVANVPAGKTAIESLNFGKIGKVFDNIRFSQIFSYKKTETSDPVSLQMIKAVLASPSFVGENQAILNNFIGELAKVWPKTDVKIEDTFISLQKSLEVVKNMENKTDFEPDDIEDLLTTLVQDTTLKEVAKTIITDTKTLEQIGLDPTTAGVVSETVGAIVDETFANEESLQTEIEAVKDIYTVANKVLNNEGGSADKATLEPEDAGKVVESLSNSQVILDTIVQDDGEGNYTVSTNFSELDIAGKLDTTTVEQEINKLDSVEDQELIKKLNALFGTSATGKVA